MLETIKITSQDTELTPISLNDFTDQPSNVKNDDTAIDDLESDNGKYSNSVYDTESLQDGAEEQQKKNSDNEDGEIVSEDEEGQVIPSNTFFPERTNILKKNEWIKFKKWGENPEETVFAIRIFGSRINL